MRTLQEIAQVEYRYTGEDGSPSLGEAYEMLLARWRTGSHDPETGKRLLFLAWFSLAEPTWLTGLRGDPAPFDVVREVFEEFGGEEATDPEFLACLSLMTRVAPYALGEDPEYWVQIGQRFEKRAPRLGGDIAPENFADRGAFGHYFEHHARQNEGSDRAV